MRTVLLLLLSTAVASAADTQIRYRNTSPTTAGAAINACNPFGCSEVPSVCGPLSNCEAMANLRPGAYPFYIQIRAAGPWSPNSNTLQINIPPVSPCDFDYSGDGTLTPSDFGTFLRWFILGYLTPSDFGVFLSRFGRTCA